MAVTRLKRKGRRNKVKSKIRREAIQRLNGKPVVKMVDVEAIKDSFKNAPKKKEAAAPKAEKAAPKAEKAETKEAAPKAKKQAKGDDLKKIEGIGPKTAELFNNAGIVTFADMAAADTDKLKGILEEAGSRYKSLDPTTWPKQAGLAAEGKWDELKALQDELNGGK